MSPRARALPRSFYARDSLELAPALLNKLLGCGTGDERAVVRIVEVEAYRGSDDPASHAYRGMTKRNATMFGPSGHLYVYFTYGMHWCANVVCATDHRASAVLLRAAAPIRGVERMRERRGGLADRVLCSGPARLTQALAITGALDGTDLVRGPVRVYDDGTPPPARPGVSCRIGLREGRGDDRPWRFFVEADPNLSRREAAR